MSADDKTWASYSQLTTHRGCPQRWFYSYERRLEKADPLEVKVEMDFGIWWQALIGSDAIHRGRQLDTLRYVPDRIKTVDGGPELPGRILDPSKVFQAASDWWATQTPLVHDTWAERLGEHLLPRLDYVYSRWLEKWESERRTEAPLAVEFGWGRDLPDLPQPGGVRVDPNTRLVGYVDEIYFDAKRNMVVVRDNKAHKTLSTQTTADDMMDSQLQFYAWGAAKEVALWGHGPIRATAYDRVRSVKPKLPVVTQSGTLSKSVTDYDLFTYLQWCLGPDGDGVPYPGRLKDGSAGGFYQAEESVVDKLSTPAAGSIWFQRTLVPLSTQLIKTHLRAAVDSSLDLQLSRERSRLTGAAARNLSLANCRWCDFARLCRAELIGGPDGDYDLADFNLRERSRW